MGSQQRENISEMKDHDHIITHHYTTEGEQCYACDLGEDVVAPGHGLRSSYDDKNNRNPDLGGLVPQRESEVRGCCMRYWVCPGSTLNCI